MALLRKRNTGFLRSEGRTRTPPHVPNYFFQRCPLRAAFFNDRFYLPRFVAALDSAGTGQYSSSTLYVQ